MVKDLGKYFTGKSCLCDVLTYFLFFYLCSSAPLPHSVCFEVLIQIVPMEYEEIFLYIEPHACFENLFRVWCYIVCVMENTNYWLFL